MTDTANTQTINVNNSDYGVYVLTDATNIISPDGSHLFYIDGSRDTLTTGVNGSQLVESIGDYNVFNLKSAATAIIAGDNNTVNGGPSPDNLIFAEGQGNIVTLGGGFDTISLLGGADVKLDFTTALKGTDWDGSTDTLANYISSSTSQGVTTISLSPTSHGVGTALASVTVPGGTV